MFLGSGNSQSYILLRQLERVFGAFCPAAIPIAGLAMKMVDNMNHMIHIVNHIE